MNVFPLSIFKKPIYTAFFGISYRPQQLSGLIAEPLTACPTSSIKQFLIDVSIVEATRLGAENLSYEAPWS